ncbi:hypothetical protein [Bradyrhizobium sp. SEMIA]|uniref:hypothetical protein n=1 Tax=Bradyrhizobium sp. SEMIA TaxID=2597515 RepID=UPI0018A4B42D|nr:hypothetical protein [Bradyrhizobium sp. SEMIA]QOG23423.1 hypothetical protein FOM02_45475 [Bradyrhizobium sp. SEMIA]
MTNLRQQIEDAESKAAESELLGNLSADEEVRIYNRRLAVELKQHADRLRRQLSAAGKGG